MKNNLIQKLKESASNLGLSESSHIFVALSGGADSVALLVGLKRLGYFVSALHLNHSLRGEDADRDERYSKSLCEKLGVPFFSEKIDVEGFAKAEKRSFEDAARVARYDFFARAMLVCEGERSPHFNQANKDKNFGVYLATAHHAGDNAETFVMNALRGSGLRGLCGIPEKGIRSVEILKGLQPYVVRSSLDDEICVDGQSVFENVLDEGFDNTEVDGTVELTGDDRLEENGVFMCPLNIIRPLLSVHKDEIISFLEAENISWCEDDTNHSMDYLRNRVRRFLVEEDGQKIADCIDLLKRDQMYFDQRVREIAEMHVDYLADGVCLLKDTDSLHSAEFSRLILLVIERILGSSVNITQKDVDAVMGLERTGARLLIGQGRRRIHVFRGYKGLEFLAFFGDFSRGDFEGNNKENYTDFLLSEKEVAKGPRENSSFMLNNELAGLSKGIGVVEKGLYVEKSAVSNVEVPLSNAEVTLENCECVEFRKIPWEDYRTFKATDKVVAIDLNKVVGELRVRTRRAGDRIRPFGMSGHKKVKKILIDKKIDARLRNEIPIVVDDEKIIWIAGVTLSEDVRIDGETEVGVLERCDLNENY